MVRTNSKRNSTDHGNKNIKIDRNSIKANQFLEITTAKSIPIESIRCSGMGILAKKTRLDGEIISSEPIILAAMKIHLNQGDSGNVKKFNTTISGYSRRFNLHGHEYIPKVSRPQIHFVILEKIWKII
ncbi:MAG: hypothetical protein LBT70_01530 [Holosporaceae bacterium]|jgi:hypothetical protein|nr:hypothetical protein [Holosporaceae bacterium]